MNLANVEHSRRFPGSKVAGKKDGYCPLARLLGGLPLQGGGVAVKGDHARLTSTGAGHTLRQGTIQV